MRIKKRIRKVMFPWKEEGHSKKGALPDFIIIGAQRCGTSFLYDRLCEHPYVERAATKEVHYFDRKFDKGTDWYKSCFPPPAQKEGRRVITGEASPYYLYYPHAAGRAAKVVPQAKLIALLRNPVDRAYSNYQLQTRLGREPLSFEEAIEAEEDRLRGEEDRMLADESYVSVNHQRFSYLSRGIYVDQLQEWHKFFKKEQVLILKSEDFFSYTLDTLKLISDFLNLPDWWDPRSLEPHRQNDYAHMNPVTRERLTSYFEPHNRRLYTYLGIDFGW